jgi:diacylglycerol kinase family enzyme
VIYNPAAARGRAGKRLEEWRRRLPDGTEFCPTQGPGHAEELARQAALVGLNTVAAAGGDGTVHEVANGLLRAKCPQMTFAVIPSGSANDYAHSLANGHDMCDSSTPRIVDVGLVSAPGDRSRYFVNTLGLGFSSAVAVESRRVRRLQGLALYGIAFLRALLFRFQCPPMTITVDGTTRQMPTLSLTVANGRREGNLVVAPQAILDDGWFDYLQVGGISRREILRYLPRLACVGQLPADHPAIHQGRCRHIILHSEAALTVHLDGEFFCRGEDRIHDLDIRIIPGALRVQLGPLSPYR